jgi:hypothetical protein
LEDHRSRHPGPARSPGRSSQPVGSPPLL